MDRQLENAYESVLRRNPGEAEFHQAVREIFESLGPVLDTNPQYVEAAVLSRICEPERQIIFRVRGLTTRARSVSTVASALNIRRCWGRIRVDCDSTPRCT